MKVADFIRDFPGRMVTVEADASIEEVAGRLTEQDTTRDVFVVDDARRLVGYLSHRHIAARLLAEHRPRHSRRQLAERAVTTRARDVMHRLKAARPTDLLEDVLHRLLHLGLEDMPVVDETGHLVGAINLTEVMRASLQGRL